MKKILVILWILLLVVFTGCKKSLDIPEIEGSYNFIHKSKSDDALITKRDIVIKKIGENKYSISIDEKNSSEAYGNINLYQEIEILEIIKGKKDLPLKYKIIVREITSGKGMYTRYHNGELYENIKLNNIRIVDTPIFSAFEFSPKSAIEGNDKVGININLGVTSIPLRNFYGYKDN